MNNQLPDRFFVAGTDTGVGKTVVSAILAVGLGASYWKPIQSGTVDKTDSDLIREVLGRDSVWPENYCLRTPVSPHASAVIDGVDIDLNNIIMPGCSGPLVVEGAGGIMVPLNKKELIVDLIGQLALPVVLVARTAIGTINHTLLSLEVLRRHNVKVVGVVMNGVKDRSNCQAVEYYGKTKVLAELEPLADLRRPALKNAFESFCK